MPTKRLIKVRSQFEDGFLKSFELISVTPKFDTNQDEDFLDCEIRVANWYRTYTDTVLWINSTKQTNVDYSLTKLFTFQDYQKQLKVWNSDPSIAVIDVSNKIIGEL